MQDQAANSAVPSPSSSTPPSQLSTAEPALGAYLAQQRWFAAHGKAVQARFVDVTELEPRVWWTLVSVNGHGTYQLPLACVAHTEAANIPDAAHVTTLPSGEVLVDACHLPRVRNALWRALVGGGKFVGPTGAWRAERCGDGMASGGGDEVSRVLGVEQSNTSIVFGKRAICKLYRRLEAGPNPDLELSAFLTGPGGFRHTPRVGAAWRFESRDGTRYDAGMLQAFVDSEGDGWAAALTAVRAALDARQSEGPLPFVTHAERLGNITRAMHAALASDAAQRADGFTPRAASADDVRGWVEGARDLQREAWSQLDAHCSNGSVPGKLQEQAHALLKRSDAAAAKLAQVERALGADAGLCMRHHGDYHLGQVLALPGNDFMVLDFEGEPLRPLATRRALHSPVRDIAGMLRSFAYAAATAENEQPDKAAPARAWSEAVCSAFLRGYGAASERGKWLPRSTEAFNALCDLFTLEKAFYELRYELSHRPAWVWIPMRGIAALLGDG